MKGAIEITRTSVILPVLFSFSFEPLTKTKQMSHLLALPTPNLNYYLLSYLSPTYLSAQ